MGSLREEIRPGDLAVLDQRLRRAGQQLDIPDERQAGENHEDRSHVFGRALVFSERGVMGREAARRDRRQRMVHRVEEGEARGQIGHDTDDRQAQIDDRDPRSDLGGARQHLAGRIEGLGAEDLHAADAQFRQEGHGHDDDPDAAEPLQHRPPQKQARRQVVESGEHRRSGRGQAGHGLEIGIRDAGLGRALDKGDRSEDRQNRPDARGDQEDLLDLQLSRHRVGAGQRDQSADHRGQDGRFQEGAGMPVSDPEIDNHRHQHRHAQRGDEQTDDISDRAQVNHGTEPWPGGRAKSIGNRAARRDRFAVRSEERIALRSA